jgi:hypothetical protein
VGREGHERSLEGGGVECRLSFFFLGGGILEGTSGYEEFFLVD